MRHNGAQGEGSVGPRLRVRRANGDAAQDSLQPARFVAIAGNMGAGKSTLTAFLESRFGIQPFYEPNDANPYLADFYREMEQYAFHSQMYFLAAKFRAHLQLKRALEENPRAVFVQDRTIYEDAEIFCRTLHHSGILSRRDHDVYMGMYEAIRETLPRPDLLIYLRCSVRGVRRRIKHRGRDEEKGLDINYVRRLHHAYEAWHDAYDLGPTLVIDSERLHYLDDLFDRTELMAALHTLLLPVLEAPPGRPDRTPARVVSAPARPPIPCP